MATFYEGGAGPNKEPGAPSQKLDRKERYREENFWKNVHKNMKLLRQIFHQPFILSYPSKNLQAKI